MADDEKKVEEIVDRKLGFFIEHLNDQFSKVLEAVESSTSKIPAMAERLETLESDVISVKLNTVNIPHDMKLLKLRTEKLDDITSQLKDHEVRISGLEQAA